jgi:predicted metal-dependent HD superfamily phosphohydrolase
MVQRPVRARTIPDRNRALPARVSGFNARATEETADASAMSIIDHTLPSLNLFTDAGLKTRFTALWQRCLLPGSPMETGEMWKRLDRRYREPHRHYHDPNHLAHCLAELDLAGDRVARPDRVEMAIWFHDVINEPGERDNEALSAEYFRSKADGMVATDFIDAVVELILVTTHQQPPDDPDQQFICDIDLASFGLPWECFMRDSDAVKAEFPGTDSEYFRAKARFLDAMLKRPRIFYTDFFHDRYEQQARENITRLLKDIRQQRD